MLILMKKPRQGRNNRTTTTTKNVDRRNDRKKLDEWYRNRRLDWDEARDGSFWGCRGRKGAQM